MNEDAMKRLLERATELMESHVYPLEETVMKKGFDGAAEELEAARSAVKAAGLWAPQMPEDYGGMGLPFRPHAQLSTVLGRSTLGHYVFGCQAPDAGNMEVLLELGTEEQKERWLRPLAAGAIRSCFSMTEPDRAGSNPTWMETKAVLEGDEWVLDGHKWFSTAADGAAFAIVMAVTEPDGPPHARASMLLVPTDAEGYEHVRRISIMGDEGSGWASHSEVRYNGVRVPAGHLIGGRGQGFLIAQKRLGPGRIHHCMRWIGICERAFEMMCKRAVDREIAPGKPLGTRQMVQDFIAESRAEIDAATHYVEHVADLIDQKGTHAARTEISCIKFFVANILQKVLDRAIQVHGALGITDDLPLSHLFRHERGARIYDGPDEVHKSSVARRILRGYGLELGSIGK